MDLANILALIASISGPPDMPESFKALASGGADPDYPVTLAPCPGPLGRDEVEGETILCGTVNVPERHADPAGRRIDLFFTVMKARSTYPEPDPVLHLHGGPGYGIVSRIETFSEIFAPLRRTRDIVMFDQRAAALSGRSATCRAAFDASIADVVEGRFSMVTGEGGEMRPSAQLQACVAEIKASGADLSAYNTAENARDAAALMQALGYEGYNLYGISYGTRLALEMLRSRPGPIRAAVIDGVAPLQIPLYDTLAVPLSQVIELTIAGCEADAACNAAYPDFRTDLRATLDRATAGTLTDADGAPLPVEVVLAPFMARNGTYAAPSGLTPYIPALIHELAHIEEGTPVLDRFAAAGGEIGRAPVLDTVRARLTETEEAAVDAAAALAELAADSSAALDTAIDRLRTRLAETDAPLARIFDDEMLRASESLFADGEKLRAALERFARLREAPEGRAALRAFIDETFPPENRERLARLVEAMSERELSAVFRAVEADIGDTLAARVGDLHLWIYACQESIPFNGYEGFRAVSAALPWPEAALVYDGPAREFFAACTAFDAAPRAGFHVPVRSEVPVLSIGSDWDVQTAPGWAALAAETLPNAQTFVIPEAGHGAIAYQPCVADMALAFLTAPGRALDERCVEASRPTFFIPEAHSAVE
ncbi:Tripeptidyl aminopeptidase precursor [Pseudoruegeria aquimaris]|uniref:Tripeptidyl aminopeptidase n=1 Tax=Pseudoruegeria aquimaris TaxID=393663 RepID=A0A1Y5R903_9RHOB|nr:alpha/beta hydrolase [Pseudoruegeria aquimaris]SLN11933.1 Tripeptidyl aminopeptidase precursor [Pseudoruegeria aquimaris]